MSRVKAPPSRMQGARARAGHGVCGARAAHQRARHRAGRAAAQLAVAAAHGLLARAAPGASA